MSDLSRQGRALVRAFRASEDRREGPTRAQRSALRASLALCLGTGAAVCATPPAAMAATATSTVAAGSVVAASKGVAIVAVWFLIGSAAGGGLLLATAPLRSAPVASHVTMSPAPREIAPIAAPGSTTSTVARAPVETRPPHNVPSVALVGEPTDARRAVSPAAPKEAPALPASAGLVPSQPSPAPVAVRRPAMTTLAEEVALVRGAEEKIREGQGDAALAILRAHEERFPNGSLEIERRAAGAVALCEMGRTEEGRAAAAAFARDYPNSPLLERLTTSCVRRR